MSWPMIFIMFFDFLINLTDVYIAGRLGKEVQASVGFVSQVYFIFIVVANALTVGTVSTISKLSTSGDENALRTTVYSVLTSTIVSGFFLSIGGFLLSGPVISTLGVPQAVKEFGIPLVEVYACGLVFHYFLITTNGILRAHRMVKQSMITMACVCGINLALNFTLVFNTPLGFRGIALSTALSYLAGALINAIHVKKLFTGARRFSIEIVRKVARIGWPAGMVQVMWQLGSAVLFIILSKLPENNIEVLAAFTNGLRIEAAIFLPAFAFNMANAVVVGNLIGAGRKADAFRGGMTTAAIGVGIITVLTAIVVLQARSFSSFLSGNETVIGESVRYLYISMASEPFMAWAVITGGALSGAGDTRGIMKIVVFSQWAVRLPMAYLLGIVAGLGPVAVWWSMNASIFVHFVLITRRYLRGKWVDYA